MVQIAGKYLLEKNENFLEQLISYGIPEDKAKIIDESRPYLEIIVEGKKITLKRESNMDNGSSTLVLDEEVDEPSPLKTVVKSTAKLIGDTLTVTSKSNDGNSSIRTYKFTDTTLVLTLEDAHLKTTSKRYYKRV